MRVIEGERGDGHVDANGNGRARGRGAAVTIAAMSLTADAKPEGARAEHVRGAGTAGAGDPVLDYRPDAPPGWRRSVAWRVLMSPVLHVLLLVAVTYGYNRAVYANHWVTSRPPPYFSDVAAPLYAQLEDWVYDALMPLESANWAQFFHEFGRRLRWIVPPVLVCGAWCAIVVAQLATRRYLAGWAMSLLLVAATLVMNLSVAMIDGGPREVLHPFSRHGLEYYTDVPWVRDDPGRFIREYPQVARLRLTHHARTHPPGPVLFLWAVQRYVGPGLLYASLAAVIVTTIGSVPAYWLARDLFGPTVALIAAGLYVVAPSLVLFGATCMDGVMLVPLVTATWLLRRSIRARPALPGLPPLPLGEGRGEGMFDSRGPLTSTPPHPNPHPEGEGTRRVLFALLAGLALAVAAFMTYSVACLGVIFGVYALCQLFVDRRAFLRTATMLLIAAATFVGATYALSRFTGYDPIGCLQSAIRADDSVVGRVRAHTIDVGFANLVAFGIGAGMVTSALWLRNVVRETSRALKRHGPSLIVPAFFVSIVVLAFARLFTLEVERVWMFLVPLVLIAAARELTVIGSPRPSRLAVRTGVVMLLLFAQTWLTEILLYTWW